MQLRIYTTLILICTLLSCSNEKESYFQISSDQVGLLNRESRMQEVEELYAADSIVRDTLQMTIGMGDGKWKIYEKGGKHMLTLTPNTDSIPGISHILISDPRFTTVEGTGLSSTFGEIKASHSIDKIVTSLNNVVVLLKDSDIYFTIDKEELPAHLRYTKTRKIELVEIPDKARLKYFMVGWN